MDATAYGVSCRTRISSRATTISLLANPPQSIQNKPRRKVYGSPLSYCTLSGGPNDYSSFYSRLSVVVADTYRRFKAELNFGDFFRNFQYFGTGRERVAVHCRMCRALNHIVLEHQEVRMSEGLAVYHAPRRAYLLRTSFALVTV